MNAFMRMLLSLLIFTLLVSGCASGAKTSLYEQLGGEQKIEQVVDNFITEIEYSPEIFTYFENSDVGRFREKLIEHLCMLTGGPCEYTGDTMQRVHAGMNISERDFNLGVDLFISAMTKADIPHPMQNKVLATMTPTRKDIMYQ